MRAIGLLAVVGVGCVSFPHAGLLQGTARLEVVQGPVVCGPIGFRTVPLQSRWGEYVRVTVAAPGALSGTVLVHANGIAQPAREWNSQSLGALVVEARFPNENVDARFALERDRPIDITLTGLAGMCEGAVFTLEHGALVPSIDERAWIVELERRGGPELAARREMARAGADARRQAHYAQWAAREELQVSAEVRLTHYAQWDARRESERGSAPEVRTASVPSTPLGQTGGATTSVTGLGQTGGATTSVSGLGQTGGATTSVTGLGQTGGNGQTTPVLPSAGEGAVVARVETSLSVSSATASMPGEWIQPADANLRASVEENWNQPFEPRLEAVAVSTQSQVATGYGYVEPHAVVVAPVVFEFLMQFGAAAVGASIPAPVHGARPIR